MRPNLRVLWLLGHTEVPPTSGMSIYSQGLISQLARRPDVEVRAIVSSPSTDLPANFVYARTPVWRRWRDVAAPGALSGRKMAALGGCGAVGAHIVDFDPKPVDPNATSSRQNLGAEVEPPQSTE